MRLSSIRLPPFVQLASWVVRVLIRLSFGHSDQQRGEDLPEVVEFGVDGVNGTGTRLWHWRVRRVANSHIVLQMCGIFVQARSGFWFISH